MCDRDERGYKINFKVELSRTIKTALELGYGDKVVAELKRAKTVSDLTRIMKTARLKAE